MCQLFAGQPRENYRSQSRSLRLNGQSTSIRLEAMFWRILDEIATTENLSTPRFISKLHSEIMELHGEASNFSSLLRCTCLVHAERLKQAPEHLVVAPDWRPDPPSHPQASMGRP